MIKQTASSIPNLLLLTFILFICNLQKNTVAPAPAQPCDYSQTVNVTNGHELGDGSYSYEGLLIPANLTAEYDKKILDGTEYPIRSHVRGCVCLLKPCITYCCSLNMYYNETRQTCERVKEGIQRSFIEVTYQNGSTVQTIKREAFVERLEFGCEKKAVERYRNQFWKWNLFENGTIKREGKYYLNDEYCFVYLKRNRMWTLTPLTCDKFEKDFLIIICMSLAIIINIVIICIYAKIKTVFKSPYGEGLVFHLFCLIIGLVLLVYIHWQNPMDFSHVDCRNIGFVAYLFIIISHLLMNIISLNYFATFAQRPIGDCYLKGLYCLILPVAIALFYLIRYVQDSDISPDLKPGIGEYFCWFDFRLNGIFIFYYGPIFVLICLGLSFLFLTYCAIFALPEEIQTVGGEDYHTAKKHFEAYCVYLLVISFAWAYRIFIFYLTRSKELVYMTDVTSSVCYLVQAFVGFKFLVSKNIYVKHWRRGNVADTPEVSDGPFPPNSLPLRQIRPPRNVSVSGTEESVL